MVKQTLLTEAKQLNQADRLNLISELWASLKHDDIAVTKDEQSMLDDRLAELAADPRAGRPWNEVEADLVRRVL